jgi:hypothetical protein
MNKEIKYIIYFLIGIISYYLLFKDNRLVEGQGCSEVDPVAAAEACDVGTKVDNSALCTHEVTTHGTQCTPADFGGADTTCCMTACVEECAVADGNNDNKVNVGDLLGLLAQYNKTFDQADCVDDIVESNSCSEVQKSMLLNCVTDCAQCNKATMDRALADCTSTIDGVTDVRASKAIFDACPDLAAGSDGDGGDDGGDGVNCWDVNSDKKVNVQDLLLLLGAFGQPGSTEECTAEQLGELNREMDRVCDGTHQAVEQGTDMKSFCSCFEKISALPPCGIWEGGMDNIQMRGICPLGPNHFFTDGTSQGQGIVSVGDPVDEYTFIVKANHYYVLTFNFFMEPDDISKIKIQMKRSGGTFVGTSDNKNIITTPTPIGTVPDLPGHGSPPSRSGVTLNIETGCVTTSVISGSNNTIHMNVYTDAYHGDETFRTFTVVITDTDLDHEHLAPAPPSVCGGVNGIMHESAYTLYEEDFSGGNDGAQKDAQKDACHRTPGVCGQATCSLDSTQHNGFVCKCESGTQDTTAATAATAAKTCEPCPAGYYSNDIDTSCTPCAAGTYSNPGSSECTSDSCMGPDMTNLDPYNITKLKGGMSVGPEKVASDVTCATGYEGTVTYTPCASAGETYTLSGCTATPAVDCVESTAARSTCTTVDQELYTRTTPAANGGTACIGSSTLCLAGDGTIQHDDVAPAKCDSVTDITSMTITDLCLDNGANGLIDDAETKNCADYPCTKVADAGTCCKPAENTLPSTCTSYDESNCSGTLSEYNASGNCSGTCNNEECCQEEEEEDDPIPPTPSTCVSNFTKSNCSGTLSEYNASGNCSGTECTNVECCLEEEDNTMIIIIVVIGIIFCCILPLLWVILKKKKKKD